MEDTGREKSLGESQDLRFPSSLPYPISTPVPFRVLEGTWGGKGGSSPKGNPYQQHAGVSTCVCASLDEGRGAVGSAPPHTQWSLAQWPGRAQSVPLSSRPGSSASASAFRASQ